MCADDAVDDDGVGVVDPSCSVPPSADVFTAATAAGGIGRRGAEKADALIGSSGCCCCDDD